MGSADMGGSWEWCASTLAGQWGVRTSPGTKRGYGLAPYQRCGALRAARLKAHGEGRVALPRTPCAHSE